MSERSHRSGRQHSGRHSQHGGRETRFFEQEDAEFQAAMKAMLEGSAPDKDRSDAASPRGGSRPSRSRSIARRNDGLPEVADRLDLHGSSVEEALVHLESFVVRSAVRDLRRVLVITGRGLRSPDGAPVLRRAVSAWLNREGKAWVREVTLAPERLGGEGALDVRLRRQRAR